MKVKKLPEAPGIYIFRNQEGRSIYIGKAKNLKSRVSSYRVAASSAYFSKTKEPKTAKMLSEAKSISHLVVNSEIEAILLEAELVKKEKPKYNIELKDDKTPLYIGITKEALPRVLTLRKTQLGELPLRNRYGPYSQGRQVRLVLSLLRKVIPFSTHKPGKKPCLLNQLGLCQPCPSVVATEEGSIMRKKYLGNVRLLNLALKGNLKSVKVGLLREMKEFSKNKRFEEAEEVLKKVRALEYISQPVTSPEAYLADPSLITDIREREMGELRALLGKYMKIGKLRRIECYDVAHLRGTYPTAGMVTFVGGEPDKRLYRHFRIHTKNTQSDTEMMRHVLERRKKHFDDWGRPDLIVVDGGKGQLGVARGVFGEKLPMIGLAKRFEHIIVKKEDEFAEVLPKGPALYLLQRIRDESHRFARTYHQKLVAKALRPYNK